MMDLSRFAIMGIGDWFEVTIQKTAQLIEVFEGRYLGLWMFGTGTFMVFGEDLDGKGQAVVHRIPVTHIIDVKEMLAGESANNCLHARHSGKTNPKTN